MPRARALVLLLVLLPAVAAGCLGGGPDPSPAAAAPDAPGAAPDATPPTAEEAGLGDRPHLHDYWVGRERVTLFDDVVEPDRAGDAFFATTFTALFAREARVGGAPFLLPEGQIVYEGTGRLELTATPRDPLTTSVAVSLKPAHASEFGDPVALPPAQTVGLDVTPEMTDMPHAKTSRWAFFFQPGSPGAMLGPFHLRVEIVKMRDVTLFPGHPDLFEGAPSKVLFAGHHRTEKPAYATRIPYLLQHGHFGEPEFAPTHVVPMETTLLRVEVSVTASEATAGEVTEVRFFYRGADSNNLQPGGRGDLSKQQTFVFDVPVTMEMTDSPYAAASQWRFMVEPATQLAGPDPTCGGCVDAALEFDAVVTAYRVPPEDAAA